MLQRSSSAACFPFSMAGPENIREKMWLASDAVKEMFAAVARPQFIRGWCAEFLFPLRDQLFVGD